jgi:mannose/cellobiose epimerase-like protein (N-acyl-D-glucosamine 2-epimerase family)
MTDLSEKLNWFREHLTNDILPRWLTHARTENGLFFPHLGRNWEQRYKDICTLVSQCRLIYNFSVGYRLTGQTEYLEAVNHGADALLRYFRDSEQGGWWYSCNLNGEVLDFQKDLYGHAFAIFGLTHAAIVTDREDLKCEAFDTWETVRSRFRDAHGGFAGKLTRSFAPAPHTPSQNPIMHLFEALLTLDTLDDSGRVRQGGEEVAAFVLNRLIRKSDGILPELFDADWRELSAENGGRIDVGHAFEWAYLLSRAAECNWPQDYLKPAERLLGNGLALGYDATGGGIISPVMPDGRPASPLKGWWEQCEAIRALLHFGVVRGRAEVWEPLEKVIAFARDNFIDEEYGGWFMRPPAAGGGQASFDKGSEWKVDYHVVGMCAEAIRLTEKTR